MADCPREQDDREVRHAERHDRRLDPKKTFCAREPYFREQPNYSKADKRESHGSARIGRNFLVERVSRALSCHAAALPQ